MAIKLTFGNLGLFLTAISPLIITLFVILSSAFNGDMKMIFFLIPLLIIQVCNIGLRRGADLLPGAKGNRIKYNYAGKQWNVHKDMLPTHDLCSVFELPFQTHKVGPDKIAVSLHGQFWGYSIAYILTSILATGGQGGGTGFLIFVSMLGIMDLVFRAVTRCEGAGLKKIINIFLGLVIGFIVGGMMVGYAYPGMGVSGSDMFFTFEPPQKKCRVIHNKFKCIKKRKV
tara:strand:- start:187 stop:870 length:684 start_codon:yes stop_codon:yes gene_type:complete